MKKEDTQEVRLPNGTGLSAKGHRPSGLLRKFLRSPWLWLLLLWPLGFGLIWLCREHPSWAEAYQRYVYRYVSLCCHTVTGWLPFSLAEFLLLALPIVALVYLIVCIIGIIRRKGQRFFTLVMAILRPISVGGIVFLLFVTNCGLNYYCRSAAAQLDWTIIEPTTDQLYEVCVYLADNASRCREHLPENADGTLRTDWSAIAQHARDAVNDLHQQYDIVPDGYSVPKSVLLSRGMSYLDITGVYFPWTFEANVNTDVPGFSVAFTACHELMHIRGFMHEEDANFLAYLACIGSQDETLQYAGYITALEYLNKYLRRADTQRYADCMAHLSDAVWRDLEAQSHYWTQFETPIAEVAVQVNDAYLKQNNQTSGVISYSKMAELVITHYLRRSASAVDSAAAP